MKKSILCIIFACCNILLIHAENKQYVGLQVGFTHPITRLNVPTVGQEKTLNATAYNGLKVGFVYDATIVKGFGYTIGLNYTFGANATDWMKEIATQPSFYPQVRSRGLYHQVEIPVDWQYKFEIAQRTWLILYTGPTLQCGLVLKDKWYARFDNKSDAFTLEENLYSKEDMADYALKRLNVTWGIGAGLQYERYFLRGGYDFGLINPYKAKTFNISENYQPYTRGRFDQWQIKLGVYFWKK